MKTAQLKDVKVPVQVVIGECELSLEALAGLVPGSIIELGSFAGEPVDLFAAGEKVAKGEVVVLDEKFGVRVTGLVPRKE